MPSAFTFRTLAQHAEPIDRGGGMDFIERIFGISPDGGSGSFEMLLFLIPIGVLVVRAMKKKFPFHRM
jgi:hypothetical protein